MLRVSGILLLCAATGFAEKLEFEIKAGEQKIIQLPSLVDDSNLRDPVGYAGHGPQSRPFTRRIELVNTGTKPLVGRLLVPNGKDFTSFDRVKTILGPNPGVLGMQRLFSFWRDHRSHGGTGQKLTEEPFAALNFWGYTLCGDDTQALARLAYAFGVPARIVPLNGHIAAEFECDGQWRLFDGDQNAYYLKLDNKTVASFQDIHEDPFLALRTKVFGKHSPMSRTASAFNTALLEHVSPGQPKPIRLKTGPAPINTFTVEKGETIIWHADTPPEQVVGNLDVEKPDILKAAALASIEHQINVAARPRAEDGTITVREPFPITKVVDETTGESVTPKEPIFKAVIKVRGEQDKVTVYMQCSKWALPLFTKGANSVALDAQSGKAAVTYLYDAFPKTEVPAIQVTPEEKMGKFTKPPAFKVATRPLADTLWWQISSDRSFTVVHPNFDSVTKAVGELSFDPLTNTFFNPGQDYFIRVKARAGGIWGEWSEPVSFRVGKPSQPQALAFAKADGGKVELSWVSNGDEYLVFGSNRIDFLPEVFDSEEILEMNHLTVTRKQPAKNLVASVSNLRVQLLPEFRFYRVVARRNGMLSVPSALQKLPDEFAAQLPQPSVLQVRASKNGTKDIYQAKVETIQPPKPAPAPEPAKADATERKDTGGKPAPEKKGAAAK